MGAGRGMAAGGRVAIPAGVRRTIADIKEIAGGHSDEEVYAMLRDCNMDPDATAQKLLLQASYLMELAAIDWFKDTKRMDNVGMQKGCVAQVAAEKGMFTFVANMQIPRSTHYSLVMYFVTSSFKKGSLLQRFFNGDNEFRNSRLKLIPSVPKGSWIVRQSVGSTPCLLGKVVACSYVRGPGYLEVDVDIGSSAVANGVLGLVFGVFTTLVVDMAFLIQDMTVIFRRGGCDLVQNFINWIKTVSSAPDVIVHQVVYPMVHLNHLF